MNPRKHGARLQTEQEEPDLEAVLAGRAVYPEPEKRFHYSNCGYTVFELLVEEVTGTSFSDYLQWQILRPLGMRDSTFRLSDRLAPLAAIPHTPDGRPAPIVPIATKAAGGLYTTAGDLARFVIASLDPYRITEKSGETQRALTPHNIRLLHEPIAPLTGMLSLISDDYGYGHFVETLPTGNIALMHGGENTGFLSMYYIIPETGDGLVLLQNSDRGFELLAEVTARWAAWTGIGPPKQVRVLTTIALGLRLLAVCAAAGALAMAILFILQLIGKKRSWNARGRACTLNRLPLATGLVATVVLWWLAGFPFLFDLLARSNLILGPPFTALCAAAGLITLLPKRAAGSDSPRRTGGPAR